MPITESMNLTLTVTASNFVVSTATTSVVRGDTTPVVFSVKNGVYAVAAEVPVVFAASTDFTELATEQTYQTDEDGNITVPLTPITTGSVTISASINGMTSTVPMTIDEPSYTVNLGIDTLSRLVTDAVPCTIQKNGVTVGSGVSVKFLANANFAELATDVDAITNNDGQCFQPFTANLDAPTSVPVSIVIDGVTLSANFNISANVLTATPTPGDVLESVPVDISFNIQNNGRAVVPGVPVTISANTDFAELASADVTTSTTAMSNIAQTLTAIVGAVASNEVTLTFSDSTAIQVPLNVTPAVWGITADTTNLTVNQVTLVEFRLTNNGQNITGQTAFTVKQNANFTELAAADVSTNTAADGTFDTNLTPTVDGTQTVTAVFNGSSDLTVDFTVAA